MRHYAIFNSFEAIQHHQGSFTKPHCIDISMEFSKLSGRSCHSWLRPGSSRRQSSASLPCCLWSCSAVFRSPPCGREIRISRAPIRSVSVLDGVRSSPGRESDLPRFSHSVLAAMIRIFLDFSVQVIAAPRARFITSSAYIYLAMWSISELFFLFVGSLLIINYLRVLWNSRSLPPGPFPLPFVGNLWRLKFQLHPATLTQLSRLYGKIYTVWLGDSPLVVLNGWRAVKDGIVSHSEELSGRPVASYLKDLLGGGGILMANGHVWKQQRRFGLMTLRNLGLGKRGLESRIQDEAQYIVESFRAHKGAPFDPFNIVTATVANVISAVVFGHRFSIDDATYQELIKTNHGLLEGGASPWAKMYDILPWLMKHVPGPHQTAFAKMKFMRQFLTKELRTHKENGLLEEPQDVIDYYLEQIEKRKTEVDSTFDEENLISMIIDLFLAGTETTTTTLQWALLYMVAYPHIQQKVHEELDAVLDGSKTVCYEDRKRLPYTNAVMHEIQRYANIAAVGIPRTCVKEVNVYTYSLKKDTMVLANLDSVLFDPQCWKTPDQFNPNHFLDDEGNFLMNEAFLPFSGGARVCLGEQLARYELFIFFTTLMRSFQFHLPQGVTEVNTKYIYNLTLQPHPYQICAVSH